MSCAATRNRESSDYLPLARFRLLADARYLHSKLTGLNNVGAPTAMLEIVVSEKSIARKLPPPTPASVATPTSRFKGMLARADSLHLKRTPAPPPVPEYEKVLPPASTSPSPVVSVTPSPVPVDVKSPPIETGTLPSSPKPPHLPPPPEANATRPDNPSTGVVPSPDPQSATGPRIEEGNGPLDKDGVRAGEHELPPPPTPSKFDDDRGGVTVANGVLASGTALSSEVEQAPRDRSAGQGGRGDALDQAMPIENGV